MSRGAASDDTIRAIAERLRAAEVAGRYVDALRVLRETTSVHDATRVLLFAGHAVGFRDATEFWRHAQADIARACHQRTDGFGLR